MPLPWMKGVDDNKPIFPTYIEAIVQALNGNYVLTGLEVTPQEGTLNVDVASGQIIYNGQVFSFAGTTLTLDAEPAGSVRHDLIVWDGTDQTVKVLKGTEYVSFPDGLMSKVPNIEVTQIPLAIVRVKGSMNSLSLADVFDTRLGTDLSLTYDVVSVSSDYNAKNGEIILADASAGNITITLPSPFEGYDIVIKKVDSTENSVYVVSAGGEYIDDVTQLDIAMQDEAYRLIGNGTKWIIV